MRASVLSGAAVAARIEAEARAAMRPDAHLVALLDPRHGAAVAYVRAQERACARAGVRFSRHATTPQDAHDAIGHLNRDPDVTGVFIHAPMTRIEDLRAALHPAKDVEGIGPTHVGALVMRRRTIVPCTAQAVVELLTGFDLNGADVVVVGNSATVGLPLALLLTDRDATVTVCHKQTRDLQRHCIQADVIVTAVGLPGVITGDMVKPGAVVIDVGTTVVNGRLTGDVDPSVLERAGAVSPVPGGVGPVTVACLMRSVARATATRPDPPRTRASRSV